MRNIGGWSEAEVYVDAVNLGIGTEAPNIEVSDAMWEAWQICAVEFPPIPIEEHPITVAQAEDFYTALMAAEQCLRDLGYPISEPPSRQVIVDDVMNLPMGAWDPWLEILEWQDPQHSWVAAVRECPRPNIWDFAG